MGALRLMLASLALLVAASMLWADVTAVPQGWGLIRSAVLPAAAPMVFMVVLLDLLMCQVLKSDASPQRRRDLNWVSLVYLVLVALLAVGWVPVFMQARFFA